MRLLIRQTDPAAFRAIAAIGLRIWRGVWLRPHGLGAALRAEDVQCPLAADGDGIQGQQMAIETGPARKPDRSEEHTSELQSLMRISYAVFRLKKKTQQQTRLQEDTKQQ